MLLLFLLPDSFKVCLCGYKKARSLETWGGGRRATNQTRRRNLETWWCGGGLQTKLDGSIASSIRVTTLSGATQFNERYPVLSHHTRMLKKIPWPCYPVLLSLLLDAIGGCFVAILPHEVFTVSF